MIDATLMAHHVGHVLASGGGPDIALISGIAVPIFLFVIVPCIVFGIKGIVRIAQWLAHQQEAADRTATAAEGVNDSLKEYIEKNDKRVGDIEKDVVILKDWRNRGSANNRSEGGWR